MPNLTIVIPSKGRPELASLLSYFNRCQVEYPVSVLLSENGSRPSMTDFPSLDLHVIDFPQEKDHFAKMREWLPQVTTPLVALCTDDDLVLYEALQKSAQFLLNNPEYCACQGYHALFSQKRNRVDLASINWFTPSIDLESPLERFSTLIRRYQPICWAVFRTKEMQKIAQTFEGYTNVLFQELLWAGLAAIYGKVKRLPLLYCLRRIDRLSLLGHPLYALMESPQVFFAEYKYYRNKISEALTHSASLPGSQLERILDLLHCCFLSREIAPGNLSYFTDHILTNPSGSVHDPACAVFSEPQLPDENSWVRAIPHDQNLYRLYEPFLNPQPHEEISLAPHHVETLIPDIHRYFEQK